MKNALFLCLLYAVFFSGCTKEAPGDEPKKDETGNISCRINFADLSVNGGKAESCTVNYDEAKNLSAINSTQDSFFRSFTVVKAENQILLKTKYYGNWTYNLDEKKRIVSAHTYYDYTFLYNSEGYLSRAVVVESPTHTSTYQFIYSNGNLTKITGENSGYENEVTISYNYDLNQEAVVLVDNSDPLSYIDLGVVISGYFGKSSKNQLLAVKRVSRSKRYGFGSFEINNFTYTKDTNNQINSMGMDRIYGSISVNNEESLGFKDNLVYHFKYSCN